MVCFAVGRRRARNSRWCTRRKEAGLQGPGEGWGRAQGSGCSRQAANQHQRPCTAAPAGTIGGPARCIKPPCPTHPPTHLVEDEVVHVAAAHALRGRGREGEGRAKGAGTGRWEAALGQPGLESGSVGHLCTAQHARGRGRGRGWGGGGYRHVAVRLLGASHYRSHNRHHQQPCTTTSTNNNSTAQPPNMHAAATAAAAAAQPPWALNPPRPSASGALATAFTRRRLTPLPPDDSSARCALAVKMTRCAR